MVLWYVIGDSELVLEQTGAHQELFSTWRERIGKKARGQTSPLIAIDAIENAVLHPFAEGVRRERELFAQCRESAQSRALRHIFFAERQAGKIPGVGQDVTAQEVSSAAIIGAGTMGTGVAMCFANAGIPARPAGPAPITATLLPVVFGGTVILLQPF